jgi:hypothetical protein
MSTKKEKFVPLPNGTKLIGNVPEVYRVHRATGMPAEWIMRTVHDQVCRYERGWYYLTEYRIKPDQIGPGKTWEIDE